MNDLLRAVRAFSTTTRDAKIRPQFAQLERNACVDAKHPHSNWVPSTMPPVTWLSAFPLTRPFPFLFDAVAAEDDAIDAVSDASTAEW